MKKKIVSAITVVLCLTLMTMAAMTAVAAGGETAEKTSSESGTSVSEDSSKDTGSTSSTGSASQSSASGSSASGDSSGNTSDSSSSKDSSKENESDSSSSKTSSSASSKSSGHVKSGGAGKSKTFIDEDDVSGNNDLPANADEGNTGYGNEGVEDDEDVEHYETEITTYGKMMLKIIWIPIVIAVLCIVGLLYVNISFNNKYGKGNSHGNAKRKKKSAVKRRR